MGSKRKTEDDYKRLANDRKLVWLGPMPRTVMKKTWWQCGKGHKWESNYDNIRAGNNCPKCTKQRLAQRYRNGPEVYKQLAQDRGFTWLGPEVPTVSTNTWWQCEQGHKWSARYNNVKTGTGCPFCQNRMPKTPQDYINLGQERGFVWLGPEVKGIQTNTWWQCKKGHVWKTTYNNIQQGSGCHTCWDERRGQTQRYGPKQYHKIAKKQNLIWLGPEVPNVDTKTWWQCMKGHEWETIYDVIQRGSGCPECANELMGERQRKKPKHYIELAQSQGFTWLGPEVSSTGIKTQWQCDNDHRWETTYNSILQGTGCPHCNGTARRLPKHYTRLAKENEFIWLGPEVPNTGTKTQWQCRKNHKWETTYDKIRGGRGCPVCNQSRGERKIAKLLRAWQISFTRQKKFKDCKNIFPLPFDFFFKIDNVVFLCEYHGRQHYEAIDLFGGKEALAKTQYNDAIKAKFAKDKGFVLIVIPHWEFDNIEQILKKNIIDNTQYRFT